MNLSAFSVSNFRSIANTQRLPIGPKVTTLIGPNNEGKSNILRSLVAALQAIPRFGRGGPMMGRTEREAEAQDKLRVRIRMLLRDSYDWERDFPISHQDDEENNNTLLTIEFEPTKRERGALSTTIGSVLQGNLLIEIRFGKTDAELQARDAGSKALLPGKVLRHICRFVGNSVNCQYIPSLRTADSAREIVEQIVDRELSALEEKRVYRVALAQIAKIQKPVLLDLSKSVTATLREFLPSVKRVRLRVSAQDRVVALRRACSIIVDDGAETNLKEKGDGVQSLAALSLMRHAALLGAGGKASCSQSKNRKRTSIPKPFTN